MNSAPVRGGTCRIIIADDESLIRLDLREMLTHLGYDVIGEASDGNSAMELARKLRPDLVIMDIKMPDLDGGRTTVVLPPVSWHALSFTPEEKM